MPYAVMPECRRPSCHFLRAPRRRQDGTEDLPKHCSAECAAFMLRARRALRHHDGAEAAELLRLSDVLDARKNKFQRVPEVFTVDRSKAE
ncbi:hypothetical protein ABZ722_33965 [Streptomyces longwoodensis]|uniref:hypothetical protein n=1 Tax=Streptomyces longwoodensis TaxID=68231 RepID=UPI0033F6BFD5